MDSEVELTAFSMTTAYCCRRALGRRPLEYVHLPGNIHLLEQGDDVTCPMARSLLEVFVRWMKRVEDKDEIEIKET